MASLESNSTKAAIALWLPLIATIFIVGTILLLLVAVKRRTGRPKKSSVLACIGIFLIMTAFRNLSNAHRYEDVSWSGFLIQLTIAACLLMIAYRHSDLRDQIQGDKTRIEDAGTRPDASSGNNDED